MRKYEELPEFETPIFKYGKKGIESLKNDELFLLILNAGDSSEDLRKRARKLAAGQYPEVTDAIKELKRRDNISKNKKITSAQDIYDRLKFSIAQEQQEHFVVITLDGASQVIAQRTVFVGTLNQSLVHPREVFADAISDRAAGIIVAHNHPSGTLSASRADIGITQRLDEVAKLVGIELLDHVIVTEDGYYSFSDEGLL